MLVFRNCGKMPTKEEILYYNNVMSEILLKNICNMVILQQ